MHSCEYKHAASFFMHQGITHTHILALRFATHLQFMHGPIAPAENGFTGAFFKYLEGMHIMSTKDTKIYIAGVKVLMERSLNAFEGKL